MTSDFHADLEDLRMSEAQGTETCFTPGYFLALDIYTGLV